MTNGGGYYRGHGHSSLPMNKWTNICNEGMGKWCKQTLKNSALKDNNGQKERVKYNLPLGK